MLASTHAVAGAVIAASFVSPQMAIAVAVISHPLLDLFPHWDFNTRRDQKRKLSTTIIISLADSLIGIIIGLILFGEFVPLPLLILCMFSAQIFDWAEAPYKVFNWHFPPFSTVKKFQHHVHSKLEWPWGYVPQVLILVLAIWLSLTLRFSQLI